MVPKELEDACEAYQGALASTEPLLRARRRDDVFAVERAESVVEALRTQLEVSDALLVPFLSTLTTGSGPAAEAIGPCILSLRLAMELDYPSPDVSRLGLAALAHEIGRARAPKESDVSAIRRGVEEQAQLVRQCGPAYADVANLVRRTPDSLNEAAPAAETPRPLEEAAHVIGLATIYHSLARQRGTDPRAWPPACLKEVLRRQRARFPDRILKALIRVLTTLPLGGLVRLNNGEIGYVVAKNAGFPLRPVVAVWITLGKLLTEPKPVDLQRDPFLYVEAFLGDARLDSELAGTLS
jgi:hypothetical protein